MKPSLPAAGPFGALAAVIYEHSGIALTRKDEGVLKTRLARRLRALGLSSAEAYVAYLGGPDGAREVPALLDAVTINYTFFFRESQAFRHLTAEVLPRLRPRPEGGPALTAWSAGCSSGEEPYALAMTLSEALGEAGRFRVLATDLNRRVLAIAARGVYPLSRLTGVPQEYRYKYLTRDAETPEGCLRVSAELRAAVVFRRLNLLEEVRALRGAFDVVLCRNVMIYFDEPTKVRLLRLFHGSLRPGGHLFLGASESLSGLAHPFYPVAPAVYRRR